MNRSMRGTRLWSDWGPGRWALAVVAALVVAGAFLVATGEQTTLDPSRSAGGTSTLPAMTTTTVLATTTVPATQLASPTTAAPAATTTAHPATTTTRPRTTPPVAIVCRNSADPACGPFRWDPAPPANQALTVSITVSPVPTATGDVVSFHVVAEDPDGRIGTRSVDYGDGTGETSGGVPPCPDPAHGPWTPPPPTPERVEATYQHTYSAPGSYTAVFRVRSFGPCPDPVIYANEGQVTVPLVVSPRL